MDPSIVKSLQEIASLLLIVHDDYLKGVTGDDILPALDQLVEDVGLGGRISTFDVERLRISVMGAGDLEMGYELFYDWLRGLGQIVGPDKDFGGKKALHYLLTQYIIPFASGMGSQDNGRFTQRHASFSSDLSKLMSDLGDFLLCLMHEIIEVRPSLRADNQTLWQQVVSHGATRMSSLHLFGVLTKYYVVPDLLTDDQLEVIMQTMAGDGGADSQTLDFAGFLQVLVKAAEDVPAYKYGSCGYDLSTAAGVLSAFLAGLGQNLLHRRVFECVRALRGSEGEDDVAVLDDSFLHSAGVPDTELLRWLWRANGISVPHVQIPLAFQCLSSLAAQRPALLCDPSAAPSDRLWKANSLNTVLHVLVGQLTTMNGGVPAGSSLDEVLYLMKKLPGLFFANWAGAPAGEIEALAGLYSPHSAILLQDALPEINSLLALLWGALRQDDATSGEAGRHDGDSFVRVHGQAVVNMHRVLGLLVEASLVPTVVAPTDFFRVCGAVQEEDPAFFTEDFHISQGRLFDALYLMTCEHWPALENWRRKRPLSAAPTKLSAKHPQREQQVFQTFLFLLGLDFPLSPPGKIITTAPMGSWHQENPSDYAASQSTQSAGSRKSGIPVPVIRTAQGPGGVEGFKSPSPHAALQVIADMIHHSRVAGAASAPVSFNSNRHSDGSPVRPAFAIPAGSFFSDHPLRDIAVLLAHYPCFAFALSPWAVFQLLEESTAAFPSAGFGTAAANTDALLTALLSKFCLRFRVSSQELSEFLAQYYLTEERADAPSAALRKEEALRSPVMDLLMTAENTSQLAEGANLLKWEYARCLALCRPKGDPLLDSMVTPFLTDWDADRASQLARVPASSVIMWVTQAAGVSVEDAQHHLDQLVCLSGPADGSVTFSMFVLFAVRCFAHTVLPASQHSIADATKEVFEAALRNLLAACAASVTAVQNVLQIDVLGPLFGAETSVSRSTAVVAAALGLFGTTIVSAAPATAGAVGSCPGDGRVPPRPPKILWDAPRFVQFCRDFGVFTRLGAAPTQVTQAFVKVLREDGTAGLDQWAEGAVPPMPLRITADTVLRLLLHVGDGQGGGEHLACKAVMPALCAYTASQSNAKKLSQDGLRLEDLLRYGGSLLLSSLASQHKLLQRIFAGLCADTKSAGSGGEVPVNVLCRALSCGDLLRSSAVAVQAKRSLQVRLRPRPSHSSSAPAANRSVEVVTFAYAEFEELFLRAAFLLWETSGALVHTDHLASAKALLDQPHLQSTNSDGARSSADAYVTACAAHSVAARSAQPGKAQHKMWGINFIGPYLMVLQVSLEAATPKAPARAVSASISELMDVSPLEVPRRSVTFGNDQVFQEASQLSRTTPSLLVTSTPPRKTSDSASNPTVLSPSAISSPVAARRGFPRPRHSSSPQLPDSTGPDSPLRERSPSPKVPPSPRILGEFRDSSEQFVVAVDALLAGTKEALWPVYATYCSCGDSVNPGKLSGANLFTLLSKLGVLTDHTPLSDVGILLHQTSAHTLTGSSVNAVAMLYESGSYCESPSLTFEEFIVFLCAFSQLRYDGAMLTPDAFRRALAKVAPSTMPGAGNATDIWYKQWQDFMGTSRSFRHLLEDCILPILQKQMILAFPEDARLRDRFCSVFSLEVLIAVEGVEGPLLTFFETERARQASEMRGRLSASLDSPDSGNGSGGGGYALRTSPSATSAPDEVEISAIISALKRINLIPSIMGESQVLQLIRDVLPEGTSKRRGGNRSGSVSASWDKSSGQPAQQYLLFPQWEWVLSVVAFQAVHVATEQSPEPTPAEKIPAMVADVIATIAAAITQSN